MPARTTISFSDDEIKKLILTYDDIFAHLVMRAKTAGKTYSNMPSGLDETFDILSELYDQIEVILFEKVDTYTLRTLNEELEYESRRRLLDEPGEDDCPLNWSYKQVR